MTDAATIERLRDLLSLLVEVFVQGNQLTNKINAMQHKLYIFAITHDD